MLFSPSSVLFVLCGLIALHLTSAVQRQLQTDANKTVHAARVTAAPTAENQTVEQFQRKQNASCLCVPWNKAYSDLGVTCGQVLEYPRRNELYGQKLNVLDSKNEAILKNQLVYGKGICEHMFLRLGANPCVQSTYQHKAYETSFSWCYVSQECSTLRGGDRLPGTDASWKVCQPNTADTFLSTWGVEAVITVSKKFDLDAGVLMGYGYPHQQITTQETYDGTLNNIIQMHWGQSPNTVVGIGGMDRTHDRNIIEGNRLWTMQRTDAAPYGGRPSSYWNVRCRDYSHGRDYSSDCTPGHLVETPKPKLPQMMVPLMFNPFMPIVAPTAEQLAHNPSWLPLAAAANQQQQQQPYGYQGAPPAGPPDNSPPNSPPAWPTPQQMGWDGLATAGWR